MIQQATIAAGATACDFHLLYRLARFSHYYRRNSEPIEPVWLDCAVRIASMTGGTCNIFANPAL
jgi:hypothetical protein